MRIALLQISTGADKGANLELVRSRASAAAEQGARLLVFPEATSQAFGTGRLDAQAEDLDDGVFAQALKDLAQDLGVVIVAGMFTTADTVRRDGNSINRVHNTALVTGQGLHEGYNKIHTYDAFGYRESDTVKPGDTLHVFECDGVRVGVAICYDIRFPEQFKDLARRGAEVIVVPTSWQDGADKVEQWRVLSRARALDSTSWILACGQARPREERTGPAGIGHSAVIDPAGRVIAEGGDREQTIIADIDPELVSRIRKSIPVLS
ncbi:carbon-nitrogen hydrolase family protein [Corynebacterium pacaense]|uniref:carbon-nitrogen hydrolase family protein n=1 Tax=Corynebacterium pacaense TaxID=1816684 RepID=UPI0009BB545C|nr:carbon-nitrogen hydrolase family protein [Corynebacterium pacaense]